MTDTVNETSFFSSVTRRRFLGGAAGALVIFSLESASSGVIGKAMAAIAPGATPTTLTGWITVNSDNSVTIGFGGAEMGQGIATGLCQAAAEELFVSWPQVNYAPSPNSAAFISAGSYGVRGNYDAMRKAGAQAREMLLQAAANRWSVSRTNVTVKDGVVTNTITSATLTYAQLTAAAAVLTPPSSPTLTDPANFRLIGKTLPRLDLPGKVNGSAVFGIDVQVPGMVFAAVKNAPVPGGTVKTMPTTLPTGATSLVNLGNAVAAVATNSWAAMQAASAASVTWNTPATASSMTSATIATQAATLMTSGVPGTPLTENVGTAGAAFTAAAVKVEQTYSVPYLAHVCMEVPNCTVSITPTSAEVWVPTQAVSWVVGTVTSLTGLPASAVTVHPTLLGGGFGRKIEQDYVAHAVKVGMAVGKPVKLMWSREEDFGHDQYRPTGLVRMRVGLDGSGNVSAYQARVVTPSPLFQRGWMSATGNDNTDGAVGTVYAAAIPNRLVEYVLNKAPVPVGFVRSVGESINVFAVESAIDEAALASGQDPLAFRQRLLAGNPRALAVLNAAANGLGWSTPPAAGFARGLAISNGFGSITALAAEVTKDALGNLVISRLSAAIDCGMAVNPGQVEAQIQGGLIQGVASALWQQTTFSSGKASSRNFNNNRVARMRDVGPITVTLIQSGAAIGGVGEAGVPLPAPALANAWAALTGTRLRSLPMFPAANTMGGS